ncbi:hypothetical protein AAVH_07014 [Aphelenchoides avenae]|nr:hypothetical protein AAVH_07014 [Aphelenchus avenae]
MDDPGEVMQTDLSVNYKDVLRAQTPVITADEEIVIDGNSPIDKALTRIHAEVPTSKDAPLSYAIVENPDNLFRIDSETGELFLTVDPSRVPPGEYDVLLQASVPGGQSSQKALNVRVVPMLSPPTTSSIPSTKESSASEEPATSQPSLTSLPEAPAFAQSEYTFVIEHPARGAEVGQLQVTNPAHHPTSKLFVKEVPTDLEGRQRAEFSVVVQNVNNPRLPGRVRQFFV